jgi:hypothetical protein
VVGRLARDAGPHRAGILRGELEEHLAGMADTHMPEPPGIDLRVRGDVAEDGELVLELQRRTGLGRRDASGGEG